MRGDRKFRETSGHLEEKSARCVTEVVSTDRQIQKAILFAFCPRLALTTTSAKGYIPIVGRGENRI